MLKVNKIDISIPKNSKVKLKEMGNVFEIMYQDRINYKISIKKLNENEYLNLATGEVVQCNHIRNRGENLAKVAQSLKHLRDKINANVVDAKKCRWVTLTYAENMTNTERLYIDFKNFIKRLRYNLKQHFEYIVAMEPQGRGSWHAHLILIFENDAPYIPNTLMQSIWQQGFTKTKKLVDIDNVGAYLTAYLGDMEFTQENLITIGLEKKQIEIKTVDEIDGAKLKQSKKFIKGGRLYMYPPKFNLYRCSRGIIEPIENYMSYEQAKEKIGDVAPIFTSSRELVDKEMIYDDGNCFRKSLVYEFYNTKRVVPQN